MQRVNETRNKSAEQLKNDALNLLDHQDYTNAIKIAEEALRLDPVDGEIQAIIAYSLTELNKFKLAKKYLDNALKIAPNNSFVEIVEANYLLRRRKFKLAEAKLLSNNLQHDMPLRYHHLIRLYQAQYTWLKAKLFKKPGRKKQVRNQWYEMINKVGDLTKSPYEAELLRAEWYLQNKKHKLALNCADKCIGINPGDPFAYFLKSYLYINKGKLKLARHWVKEGLRYAPDDSRGLDLLALSNSTLMKSKLIYRVIIYLCFGALAFSLRNGPMAYLIVKLGTVSIGFYETRRYKQCRAALSKVELIPNY